jgi:hypothetical protein
MSLDKKQYFVENLIESVSKPVIVGGLIAGFNYYENRNNYSNKLSNYYSRALIGAGSCLAARFLVSKIPNITDNEGVVSLKGMLLEPATTAGMYVIGRKVIDNSTDYMRDSLVAGSASVVSGYIMSPIDRFFD